MRTRSVVALIAAVAALVTALVVVQRRRTPKPLSVDSPAYDAVSREFFRGLAQLEVGLLGDAVKAFDAATKTVPDEPASWANLGLARLRLGDFDAAAPALERASELAPSNAAVAFLRGRFESARGQHGPAITQYKRAMTLDARSPLARGALVEELQNGGGPEAETEALGLLDDLASSQPGNIAVIVDRLRLAAKRSDGIRVADSIARLDKVSASWPPDVMDQLKEVRDASRAGRMADVAQATAFLRNVLVQVPAFLEGRRAIAPSPELIADPFTEFLRLPNVAGVPSAADDGLTFGGPEPLARPGGAFTSAVFPFDGDGPPAVFTADDREIRRADVAGTATLPFPNGVVTVRPTANALCPIDWNNDFRMDLVAAGAGGVRLFMQTTPGTFVDQTARASAGAAGSANLDAIGAWAADIEMDGDLDLVVGVRHAAPVVLRNNGDGTWQTVTPFEGVRDVLSFAWGDIDGDGDPDAAMLDLSGAVTVFANQQAGRFRALPGPPSQRVMAMALGDVNGDGDPGLVSFTGDEIRSATFRNGTWHERTLVREGFAPGAASTGEPQRLLLADLDNNGGLDLLLTGARLRIWLSGADRAFHRLGDAMPFDVHAIADLDGDGRLDLEGDASGKAARLITQGTRGYHHQIVRPRAQAAPGDQRVNSFGIGALVEVRAGRLAQQRIVTGPSVHVGLGDRSAVDVVRVVWPNGVPQAEFDPSTDRPLVANQRLKGSCPWVFADDGQGMTFVTDFLWRSPLGLRINAQDTAGISQTEDWVKIRGDQLAARNGAYDVRITAELWETHFIDHASLLVIDHPDDVSVFVDERFARDAPSLAAHAMRAVRPVPQAWDQSGRDVTDLVRAQDGRFLGTFARGRYQGVAEDHFVEIDLGAPIVSGAHQWLVAYGWIYPTDSSINVAIGQGRDVAPHGLSLEAQDARGRWVVIAPDLGFPAGKNKTILIDLERVARAGLAGARRLRLRTNLEIYWDSLSLAAEAPSATLTMQRLPASRAELRFRGFSVTETDRREVPETPRYDRLASTSPRWRDLTGTYTRFGDVSTLLAGVDDRYVIMNAGDELRLSFSAPPSPSAGRARDFVLVGDGWEKDGDYNTGFSQTVLPLPAHGQSYDERTTTVTGLMNDPVFRQHRDDWTNFHTRIVFPQSFLDGLTHAASRGSR